MHLGDFCFLAPTESARYSWLNSCISIMTGSYNLNTNLAEDLRGQILRVPNMLQLFPSWPHGERNTHCDQLRNAVDSWLEKYVPVPTYTMFRCHNY